MEPRIWPSSGRQNQRVNTVSIENLKSRFGDAFVEALLATLARAGDDGDASNGQLDAWRVAQAKDHFSELLDRVQGGHGQLIRRRHEEPVLMLTVTELAALVERAQPRRRFADVIAPDPSRPALGPLRIDETDRGHDAVRL